MRGGDLPTPAVSPYDPTPRLAPADSAPAVAPLAQPRFAFMSASLRWRQPAFRKQYSSNKQRLRQWNAVGGGKEGMS